MEPQRRKDAKNVDGASCFVWLILVPAILFFTGCKKEQPKNVQPGRLTVDYSIDKETIHVGDPVELIVTAFYPTNGVLELPEIGREKEIVLLSRDWENTVLPDGMLESETRYSITSFRLGEHVISTNRISCSVNDEVLAVPFDPISLRVESSLSDDDSTTIADIKPVHKLPGRFPRWIWILLLVTGAAFLIGLLTSKLWAKRAEEKPAPPPVPPHILAEKALQALKAKGLLEKDECNPFYTELSLILRTYLEGRFQLNAPDETSEEIIDELSRSPELTGAQRNILQEFMRQADMVKFAKGHPDRTTMESAFDTTEHFVNETKQTEEPAKI